MNLAERIVKMFEDLERDLKKKSIIYAEGESTATMFSGIIYVQMSDRKPPVRFKICAEMDENNGALMISECKAL